MNPTAPALAPAPAPASQDEEDLFALSIIDWDIGVVDQNCRKLLRVLTGIEETYAGTSNQTPGGRAKLKKQLDRLQLEKAEYREKREALILRLSQQPGVGPATPTRSAGTPSRVTPDDDGPLPRLLHPVTESPPRAEEPVAETVTVVNRGHQRTPTPYCSYTAALVAGVRIEEGDEETAVPDEDVGRTPPAAHFVRFPASEETEEDAIITLPEPSAPFSTVVGGVLDAGDGTLVDATTVGSPGAFASLSSSCTRSMADAEVVGTAGDAPTAAVVALEVAAEAVSPPEAEDSTATSSAESDQTVSPTSLSRSPPSPCPITPPGHAAIAATEAAALEAEGEAAAGSLCGPAATVEESSAQSLAPDLESDCPASSSLLAPSSFWGGAAAAQDVREPVTHEVKVRATVGARGLGLVLAGEKEGSQWVVKGFRPMPGGKPNPGQAAGIKAGDKLHQLGGVHLGSYKDGIELLEQQRGSVFITVRRQIF